MGALLTFLKNMLGKIGPWAAVWVTQILVAFGVAVTTQEFIIEPILSAITTTLSGAPATFLQTVGYVHGDIFMSMILSAYVARAAGRIVMRRRAAP